MRIISRSGSRLPIERIKFPFPSPGDDPGDNRSKGEVDYLIDDYDSLSAVPIEVKSGKDYTVHSALNAFVRNEDYHIKKAYVLSNERTVLHDGKITYLPIYDVMFFRNGQGGQELTI